MKTATKIWEEFSLGKLNTKQAFDEINKSLQGATESQTNILLKLSDKILDKEIPLTERDTEVEKAFWNATHGESED